MSINLFEKNKIILERSELLFDLLYIISIPDNNIRVIVIYKSVINYNVIESSIMRTKKLILIY